jgi:hypothetical protein
LIPPSPFLLDSDPNIAAFADAIIIVNGCGATIRTVSVIVLWLLSVSRGTITTMWIHVHNLIVADRILLSIIVRVDIQSVCAALIVLL